ncbi:MULTISPECIES: hypothetical protein [unclassified Bradyrhizobium]|uniref:hypothetical protein n=1 Tax=unclassified Bradyrhizobium TaxID=2631580 RepID=UPI0029169761|nr:MULTISPECIES: hypothetical protein [unclassified Bradyrhizobium]
MSRKPKSIDGKPTGDQAAPGVTVASSPTAIPDAQAVAKPALGPAGWSIEVATRKGRTQPRYRIGRVFGPEPISIPVEDLTTEELQALHEDVDLVVTAADDSEENEN